VRNYFYLSLGMACTGASVAISKPLADVMPVFLLGLIRCLIAAAVVAPFVLAPFVPAPSRTGFVGARRVRGPLIMQTVTGVFLFTVFLFLGVARSTALTAGIITATMPAAVAVLSYFWLKERMNRFQAAGIALAVLGVGLLGVAGESSSGGTAPLVGVGLLVLAVISEAFYTIYAKQTAEHIAPLPTVLLVNLIGAALFLPLGLWQAYSFDWALADGAIWWLIFAFSIGSSVFALVFWYMGIKHVAANMAGLFTAVMPLSAGAIALLFLGETLTPAHVGGAILVVGAIGLGAFKGEEQKPRAAS
jgi:drug/metabolite transporter (DMT)-like permease